MSLVTPGTYATYALYDVAPRMESNFTPEGTLRFGPNQDIDDNLFAEETEANTADMWLTIIKEVAGGGANYEFTVTWD